MSDINVTVTDNEAINVTIEGTGGTTAASLSSLSDTNISSPTSGQALVYDGVDSWDNTTLAASNISDFDTEVSNNASVTANTAKVSNATHSGDASGDTTLTLNSTAISGKGANAGLAGTEQVLINNGGTLERTTTQDIADLGGGGGGSTRVHFSETLYHGTTADWSNQAVINQVGGNSVALSGGQITITTSAGSGDYWTWRGRLAGLNSGWNLFDLNPAFGVVATTNNNGNATAHLTILITSDFQNYSAQLSGNSKYAGFVNKGGTIYAVSNDGTGEEATDISGTASNNTEYLYYVECSDTDVTFYINQTLVATHTTKVPTGADNSTYQVQLSADNNGTATVVQHKFMGYDFSYKIA